MLIFELFLFLKLLHSFVSAAQSVLCNSNSQFIRLEPCSKNRNTEKMAVPQWSDIKDNSIEAYKRISSFHAMIPPIRDDVISGLWNTGYEMTASTCHSIPAGKSIFPEACICTSGLCGESSITCTCFESHVWKWLPRLVSRSFSLILPVRCFLCS